MDYREQWESFLNPEVFRDRIINISMYITIYEMLKDSIISRIKDFYVMTLIGAKDLEGEEEYRLDRKSTRLNSSHVKISYAVFCLIIRSPRPTLFPYTTLFRSGLSRTMGKLFKS